MAPRGPHPETSTPEQPLPCWTRAGPGGSKICRTNGVSHPRLGYGRRCSFSGSTISPTHPSQWGKLTATFQGPHTACGGAHAESSCTVVLRPAHHYVIELDSRSSRLPGTWAQWGGQGPPCEGACPGLPSQAIPRPAS